MTVEFAFRTSGSILFGHGLRDDIASHTARLGSRVLLVTGERSLERSGVLEQLLEGLAGKGADALRWRVGREPDLALVDDGAARCREERRDVVLAVGGGSVLDAAKAIAALAANGGAAIDYVEEVGGGRSLERPALPVVAVPTTAGSGSEVTRNSVLLVPELSVKRSIRSDLMLPRLAIVDPSLSAAAPRTVAAASGLDALTHLIEAYVSRAAQPMTDALALPGIRLAVSGLQALAEAPPGAGADERALASLWGGIALANARLGAVHGLVAPLGGQYAVPHGVGCACLLPHVLRVNVAALQARRPDSPVLGRYDEVAAAVMEGDPDIERVASMLDQQRRRLEVPGLGSLGIGPNRLAAIVTGSRAGSMRGNPIELTDGELEAILRAALQPDAPELPEEEGGRGPAASVAFRSSPTIV